MPVQLSKSELRLLSEAACASHPIKRVPKSAKAVSTAKEWSEILRRPGKTNVELERLKGEEAAALEEIRRLDRLAYKLSQE